MQLEHPLSFEVITAGVRITECYTADGIIDHHNQHHHYTTTTTYHHYQLHHSDHHQNHHHHPPPSSIAITETYAIDHSSSAPM